MEGNEPLLVSRMLASVYDRSLCAVTRRLLPLPCDVIGVLLCTNFETMTDRPAQLYRTQAASIRANYNLI